MSQSLSEISQQLKEFQSNIIFDLQQEWNEEKELMIIQLQLLNSSIANIDILLSQKDSQLFKSSIQL